MNIKTIRLLQLIFSIGFLAGIVISLIDLLNTSGAAIIDTATNQITLSVYTTGFLAICLSYLNVTNDNLVQRKQELNSNDINFLKSNSSEQLEKDSHQVENSHVSLEVDNILKSDIESKMKIEKVLSVLCNSYNAGQGVLFKLEKDGGHPRLKPFSSYAFVSSKEHSDGFDLNDGLIGLAVKEDRDIEVNNLPKDSIKIVSGLGKAAPGSIVIIPIKQNEEMKGVLELSFFKPIDYKLKRFLQEQVHKMGSLV